MLDIVTDAQAVALIGLAGGLVLGLAARVGRFCTLGAIEDWLYGGDDRRLRMWGLAIGIAMTGAHLAIAGGILDPAQTAYVAHTWVPLASILGGLVFGYGMALSGNCGYGALARLGGGDLRSFVIVVVLGVSAYAVMSGPLAQLRVSLFPVEPAAEPQSTSLWLERTSGLPAWLTGTVAGLAIIAVALASGRMITSYAQIFWGAMVGIAVLSGWLGTQWVAAHGFGGETPRTHTFAAPIGETMIYLMTASGVAISFGVGSITGVLGGAFIGSGLKGHFRWEACDDSRELKRQILGAVMMGAGAVVATGCSIGQGVSALSVMAYGAPVTLVMIFVGATLGLRHLVEGAPMSFRRMTMNPRGNR